MRRKKHFCLRRPRPKPVAVAVVPAAPPVSSEHFAAVHAVACAAEAAGWPARAAFEAGMLLRLAGVATGHAVAMFHHASRVTQ